jgi:hypothetical protein
MKGKKMAEYFTSRQRVFSNRCIGISTTIVDLDKIHDDERMVKVIIDGSEYSLYHAADDTNRLSGISEIQHLFKKVKQFSYTYEKSHNAIIIKLSGKYKADSEKSKADYYWFPDGLRENAERMAKNYVIFYCLENFLRDLVSSTLELNHSPNWWDDCVDSKMKRSVNKIIEREIDNGVTVRSKRPIDFTTFRELRQIIEDNWSNFEPIFISKQAFGKTMDTFNALRGPIAHSGILVSTEEKRLDVNIRYWFESCLKQ